MGGEYESRPINHGVSIAAHEAKRINGGVCRAAYRWRFKIVAFIASKSSDSEREYLGLASKKAQTKRIDVQIGEN
jgi:hypothetical protein